jgi:hypothetical protein
VQARTVVIAGIATLVAIAFFAGVDLMRPSEERAHLGRLVERIGDDGLSPLIAVVERKFEASLRESTRSLWVLAIPIGIALIASLGRLGKRPLVRIREQIPTMSAGLVAIYVGAFLGSAVNDSGAIVGGLVFFTLSGFLAFTSLESTS